jgi:hypothetical protein
MWLIHVISAFGRLRQEDCEFEASLDYIVNLRTAWANYKESVSKKEKRKISKY